MRSIKSRLVFSVLFGLGAILISWLIQGDSSPFADYFRWNVGLPNLWAMLNALPYIAAAILSDDSLILFTVLQFIQWFVVGFVLSLLLARFFGRRLR